MPTKVLDLLIRYDDPDFDIEEYLVKVIELRKEFPTIKQVEIGPLRYLQQSK